MVEASASRVEEGVRRAVPRFVGDLSTEQLIVLSLRLYRRYYGSPIDPRGRKKVLKRLRQAAQDARAPHDEAIRSETTRSPPSSTFAASSRRRSSTMRTGPSRYRRPPLPPAVSRVEGDGG